MDLVSLDAHVPHEGDTNHPDAEEEEEEECAEVHDRDPRLDNPFQHLSKTLGDRNSLE